MLAKQYLHRLPADYDMQRIRDRAAARAHLWDTVDGLAFKAFMLQNRGQNGANRNAYSSLYLWLSPDAALDFISDERFASVIATFGRPAITTWLPIDARRGAATTAQYVMIEQADIPMTEDLSDLRKKETARNIETVQRQGILASMAAIDLSTWRIARFVLSETMPTPGEARQIFDIAYLAKPGLPKPGLAQLHG